MSCAEYDAYLLDPLGFRSAHQREHDRARRARHEAACLARARVRVDEILRERELQQAAAAAAADTGRRRRRREEEVEAAARRRRAAAEVEAEAEAKAARRVRAARARAQLERVDAERRRRAAEVERRRGEELRSEVAVARTTKGCPRCGTRIEKNEGCMHMTCRFLPPRWLPSYLVYMCVCARVCWAICLGVVVTEFGEKVGLTWCEHKLTGLALYSQVLADMSSVGSVWARGSVVRVGIALVARRCSFTEGGCCVGR